MFIYFLSVPYIVFAIGYLIGTYFQFLPLPHDVASVWNMAEIIPLFYQEVGQLGTGDTFLSCTRSEEQSFFLFVHVLNTDYPIYNLIDY